MRDVPPAGWATTPLPIGRIVSTSCLAVVSTLRQSRS